MQMVFKVTVAGCVLLSAGVALASPVAAAQPIALPAAGSVNALPTASADPMLTVASANVPMASVSSATPAATLSSGDLAADPTPTAIDLDGPRAALNARNAPADVPVEAIPTPTAVSSGVLALAILAGYRAVRRLRLA